MGRKCSVEDCMSDSNRPEDIGVTFHKVPMHSDVRPKWISLCHIPDDKKMTKIIYVCSRHFLRADFCNFKGKKYMLRQGVLPSVFPWDKSKLEAIKAEASIKKEKSTEEPNLSIVKKEDESQEDIPDDIEVKPEVIERTLKWEDVEGQSEVIEGQIKMEPTEKLDEFENSKLQQTPDGLMSFTINSRIEALDFNNEWFPARIVEVDYEENEVLIHFEKFSSKYDEWISMTSSRLRPLQESAAKPQVEQYTVGERCLAAWSDYRKFPATITKVMENGTYEVLFDDGFVKVLKGNRIIRNLGKTPQSSPLFEPIKSSKQDRREKKRKLNVAQLFNKKRQRTTENSEEKARKSSTNVVKETNSGASSPAARKVLMEAILEQEQKIPLSEEDIANWKPRWYKGLPVGIESSIETQDGPKNSVIVQDPRVPPGWNKHLIRRQRSGSTAKWEVIVVSPDNRKFRSRTDIRRYLEENPIEGVGESMFDFGLGGKTRARKSAPVTPKKTAEPEQGVQPVVGEEMAPSQIEETREEENVNCLKILFEDDAYKCPIEGCGKTFRRENLAQMHVKHYHPEYTRFLDSTPNVADLAYARTVGESLDRSPGPSKPPLLKPISRTSTPQPSKAQQPPMLSDMPPDLKPAVKVHSPLPPKSKDSEIIKLLNSRPFDKKENEPIQPLPSGLPTNMYPDIKLKDLLHKSEGVPKRDDINLKTLCSSRPPSGIKTLLPLNRHAQESSGGAGPAGVADTCKPFIKRKRGFSDNVEIIKGGEVIKIVRMKQEEIINCTCGFTEEDGLMIQCELCLCWQHAYCNNIERENQVPEKYICYICQNPLRERLSRKYHHDQDWLKQGVLPVGSYHAKDEEALAKRFEKLRKCHDLSGGLVELREYMHTLGIKLKIAEAKNHPKLYLWSKLWEKKPLPEKTKAEAAEVKPKKESDEDFIKDELEDKTGESQNESMLMMILKAGKEVMPKIDLNSLMDNNMGAPMIPQPEAAIDSADCRLNLLEHVLHQETLVEERLDDFEKQIEALEEGIHLETDPNYTKMRHTLQMLMRDLGTLKEFSQCTTI